MSRKMTAGEAANFNHFSAYNAAMVEAQTASCGCKAYEDIFTYARWSALGFQVRKGEHGMKVSTYIPVTRKTEDGEEKVIGTRPWVSTVFCRHQVDPKAAYDD